MDVGEYRLEFLGLLQTALAFAGGEPGNVVVVSIPDWGVTPFAAGLDSDHIAREIDLFNTVNREEAFRAGAAYVDVTDISRRAKTDLSLAQIHRRDDYAAAERAIGAREGDGPGTIWGRGGPVSVFSCRGETL